MKVKFTHIERSVSFYGKGDYVIDTDNFPELEGVTSEQEIADWAYENQDKLGVDYSPKGANKIVPMKDGDDIGTLSDAVSESTIEWEKFGDEDHYFEAGYLDEEDESNDDSEEETEEGEE